MRTKGRKRMRANDLLKNAMNNIISSMVKKKELSETKHSRLIQLAGIQESVYESQNTDTISIRVSDTILSSEDDEADFYKQPPHEQPPEKKQAERLPIGWIWTDYYDGSGHLESPDGKEYFSYDLFTGEYDMYHDRKWRFWKNYPDTMSLSEFKEFAEEELKRILHL